MVPELERHLQDSSKTQLILLLGELAARHPDLRIEMQTILERLEQVSSPQENEETAGAEGYELDEEVTEDWDFSGDDLQLLPPTTYSLSRSQPLLPSIDSEIYHQRIKSYVQLLKCKKTQAARQQVKEDLDSLLQEAERYTARREYANALALYTLVLDERLCERDPILTTILDQALDDVMPMLETLLSETSSYLTFAPQDPPFEPVPLLTPEQRHYWLIGLFMLWLKHLDMHRKDDIIPEILLDIVWASDIAFLRALINDELEQLRQNSSSNIVDLKRQCRTRALEKFLKELPHS